MSRIYGGKLAALSPSAQLVMERSVHHWVLRNLPNAGADEKVRCEEAILDLLDTGRAHWAVEPGTSERRLVLDEDLMKQYGL